MKVFLIGQNLILQLLALSLTNPVLAEAVNNIKPKNPRNVQKLTLPELRATGFVPEAAIATTNVALDGLNSSVRYRPTNLTALIAQAMLQAVDRADLAIFNSGLIQINNYISPGVITQSNIMRMLPSASKVLAIKMSGSLLKRVLEQGQANRGTGGYLQTANVSIKPTLTTWLIQGEPLDEKRNYTVAINDFLMSGQEQGLEFLNFKQPGIKLIAEKRDIRFAVIKQLSSIYPKFTSPR